jgi:hypothetical protein
VVFLHDGERGRGRIRHRTVLHGCLPTRRRIDRGYTPETRTRAMKKDQTSLYLVTPRDEAGQMSAREERRTELGAVGAVAVACPWLSRKKNTHLLYRSSIWLYLRIHPCKLPFPHLHFYFMAGGVLFWNFYFRCFF